MNEWMTGNKTLSGRETNFQQDKIVIVTSRGLFYQFSGVASIMLGLSYWDGGVRDVYFHGGAATHHHFFSYSAGKMQGHCTNHLLRFLRMVVQQIWN